MTITRSHKPPPLLPAGRLIFPYLLRTSSILGELHSHRVSSLPPPLPICPSGACTGGEGSVHGGRTTTTGASTADPPWLEELHTFLKEYRNAEVVDGDNLWFDYESWGGEYFPWRNITELLISVWALVCRPSRRSLQMLLDLLRFVDSTGRGFDRRHVPASAEHLISRMRRRLPLLPVFKRKIQDKDGNATDSLDIPLGILIQRMLDCPRIVEEYVANFAGHKLTTTDRELNRVPDEHLTPIAHRHVDGARKSYMNGDLMQSTAHMGIECILVGGGEGVRVVVGDTVMASLSAGEIGPRPCRLAALFWQESTEHSREELKLARGERNFWKRFQPAVQPLDGDNNDGYLSSTERGGQGGVLHGLPSTREESSATRGVPRRSSSGGNCGELAGGGATNPEHGSDEGSEEVEEDDYYTSSASDSDIGGCEGGCSPQRDYDSPEGYEGDGIRSESDDGEGGGDARTGYLVARLNPFIFRKDMPIERRGKRPRVDGPAQVWELVNEPVEVRVGALEGLCLVTAAGGEEDGQGSSAADGVSTYVCEGFVTRTPRTRVVQVVKAPWRRSGFHGLFLDRRSRPVYENVHHYPVFSTGIVIASDGFNYFSLGGSNFSVNGSYFALGCLSPSLLRRLRSWFLCTVGAPRARWEEDVGPLMATIQLLQNGCRARVSTEDKTTITVSQSSCVPSR